MPAAAKTPRAQPGSLETTRMMKAGTRIILPMVRRFAALNPKRSPVPRGLFRRGAFLARARISGGRVARGLAGVSRGGGELDEVAEGFAAAHRGDGMLESHLLALGAFQDHRELVEALDAAGDLPAAVQEHQDAGFLLAGLVEEIVLDVQ